jgi:hypothetical protein
MGQCAFKKPALPGRKIVYSSNTMSIGQKTINEIAANKAGATSNKVIHLAALKMPGGQLQTIDSSLQKCRHFCGAGLIG